MTDTAAIRKPLEAATDENHQYVVTSATMAALVEFHRSAPADIAALLDELERVRPIEAAGTQ